MCCTHDHWSRCVKGMRNFKHNRRRHQHSTGTAQQDQCICSAGCAVQDPSKGSGSEMTHFRQFAAWDAVMGSCAARS